MEDDWEPIQREGHANFISEEESSGLVRVVFPLKAAPPEEWVQFFLNPEGVTVNPAFRKLSVQNDKIFGACFRQELEALRNEVQQRMAHANERYEGTVLPEQRQKAASAEAAKQQHVDHVDALRREVEDL